VIVLTTLSHWIVPEYAPPAAKTRALHFGASRTIREIQADIDRLSTDRTAAQAVLKAAKADKEDAETAYNAAEDAAKALERAKNSAHKALKAAEEGRDERSMDNAQDTYNEALGAWQLAQNTAGARKQAKDTASSNYWDAHRKLESIETALRKLDRERAQAK
jgi:flagellar biosynthesis chaperone FliJ